MSQNDFIIANDTAANVRADLNLALAALASQSSGASAPTTTYANMIWYDTATNILKMRSEADDAWIDLGTLDQGTNTFTPAGISTQLQATWDTGTDTTESLISAAKLDAKINAEVPSVLNATGSAPIYACRAWVNFNGTGTVAIRASGNVSSITDNGSGQYTVNFTTAMEDADYSVSGTAGNTTTGNIIFSVGNSVQASSRLAGSVDCVILNNALDGQDCEYVDVSIFR